MTATVIISNKGTLMMKRYSFPKTYSGSRTRLDDLNRLRTSRGTEIIDHSGKNSTTERASLSFPSHHIDCQYAHMLRVWGFRASSSSVCKIAQTSCIVKYKRKADEVVQLKGRFSGPIQSIQTTKLRLDLQTRPAISVAPL